MPVMAPSGDNKRDKPRLPSVRSSFSLMPGIAATHVPNSKLEVANKKPTASTGLFLVKEIIFLSMNNSKVRYRRKVKKQH
jgi:hypothetical protein